MSAKFVAEVSSNHHQDIGRCLAFIDKAAAIGCDAVKFQLFRIRELFAPEILAASSEHRNRERWELPPAFLPKLAARCRDKKIQFSCTPFYMEAVETLLPYVDFFKIASYELLWEDLLKTCARTEKPIALSTGMATLDEIDRAVETLRANGCRDLTLLHCISGYPTPADQCNLAAIERLRTAFGCPVGWSDHSVEPAVMLRAVHRWNAAMVEFHLDLDGQGPEYAAGHCWLPDQMQSVIKQIRLGFSADGAGIKAPAECEAADRNWRADPSDGLRPLKFVREGYHGSSS